MKTNLSDVTLCAIDCIHPQLAARALEHSMHSCAFGEALLLTSTSFDGSFTTCKINHIDSSSAYSRFVLKELSPFIQTDYVLLIQWDGYIIDSSCWTAAFKQYDYIGAKWPWDWIPVEKKVGNGGFSLRSKKLIDLTASDSFIYNDGEIEDVLIAQTHHDYLVQEHGIKFAPIEVADQFSYECETPNQPTFGFHALFNMWRHLDDQSMIELIHIIDANICRGQSYCELIAHYFNLRKFNVLFELYKKMNNELGHEDMVNRLRAYVGHKLDIPSFLHICSRALV